MFAELSDHAKSLHAELKSFMAEQVYPNEKALLADADGAERWAPRPLLEELQAKAKARGLWNLFYNHGAGGQGLNNFEYAHLCETLGRSLVAPEIFNCNAPDVGNMEILAAYGTAEQKERWLKPLLSGEIRSCFAMTEPRVASSDATNIETSDPPRRRPLCRQWPQMVDHRRHVAALQGRDRDGQERSEARPSTSSNR